MTDGVVLGYIFLLVAAALSCACCFAIILSYYKFKQLQLNAFQMVLHLAVADCLFELTMFLQPYPITGAERATTPGGKLLCTLQGALQTYFELAGPCWTAVMSFAVHDLVYRTMMRREPSTWKKQIGRYCLFAWGVPLIAVIIPFMVFGWEDAYTPPLDKSVVEWCWVNQVHNRSRYATFAVQMAAYYVPLWALVIFNVTTTVLVRMYLRQLARSHRLESTDSSNNSWSGQAAKCCSWKWRRRGVPERGGARGEEHPLAQQLRKVHHRLQWYPLILVICILPMTIYRLSTIWDQTPGDDDWLHTQAFRYFSVVIVALQGTFHAIAYGLTSSVRKEWSDEFRRCAYRSPFKRCCGFREDEAPPPGNQALLDPNYESEGGSAMDPESPYSPYRPTLLDIPTEGPGPVDAYRFGPGNPNGLINGQHNGRSPSTWVPPVTKHIDVRDDNMYANEEPTAARWST